MGSGEDGMGGRHLCIPTVRSGGFGGEEGSEPTSLQSLHAGMWVGGWKEVGNLTHLEALRTEERRT